MTESVLAGIVRGCTMFVASCRLWHSAISPPGTETSGAWHGLRMYVPHSDDSDVVPMLPSKWQY